MPIESILSPLLTAAAILKKPVQSAASEALRAAFDAGKSYLRKKFSGNPDATRALELATERPESEARKALLREEAGLAGLENDAELRRLTEQLAVLLPWTRETHSQKVHVGGTGNKVQVAGRDLVIKTEREYRRSVVTPDERHVTGEQRERIRAVIGELATRLAVGDHGPNFAAVHRMIQRRYAIVSYLLIPRDKFEDALSFLIQQRAIHRPGLRRRNPAAYQNDFFRSIFAGARELSWDRSDGYQFASDKLWLKKPLTSLKQLGPVQLKSLSDFVRREVRDNRSRQSDSCATGVRQKMGDPIFE